MITFYLICSVFLTSVASVVEDRNSDNLDLLQQQRSSNLDTVVTNSVVTVVGARRRTSDPYAIQKSASVPSPASGEYVRARRRHREHHARPQHKSNTSAKVLPPDVTRSHAMPALPQLPNCNTTSRKNRIESAACNWEVASDEPYYRTQECLRVSPKSQFCGVSDGQPTQVAKLKFNPSAEWFTVADAFDAADFQKRSASRHVLILGDSVAEQWYDALVCEIEAGGRLENRAMGEQRSLAATGNVTTGDGCYQKSISVEFEGISFASCRGRFGPKDAEELLREVFAYLPTEVHEVLIILSIGYHYKHRPALAAGIERVTKAVDVASQGHVSTRLLALEVVPQHFPYASDGLYKEVFGQREASTGTCAAVRIINDWRNEVFHQKLQGRVLPLLDFYLSRADAHLGIREDLTHKPLDCSHWCMDRNLLQPVLRTLQFAARLSWGDSSTEPLVRMPSDRDR